ncbi:MULTISPECIES: late competence development ComFB family protein [unclassified Anabaena]|uniref:late competence development ComFB family protein n=1 Tax=unclassified Anabaena TaxID=2619674 RepID=UPI0014465BE2|nr:MULTISPECIES: late competence development ComFB family protein [unclassified Anabaena]MTJ07825.1 competence protein ComFB [Anabaena sp. UHCC 0204]MTJ51669.1 competence protein ComFB [Anabaena sp. UHCC 0253]
MSTLRPSLYSQTPSKPNKMRNSHNVMELLVVEEVEKQIQLLPIKAARYIKTPDVVAYALNRLPSLYATSRKGWQRQLHRAKTEFNQQINKAVQQGIIAVQRDPLRISDLIYSTEENGEINQIANAALEKLKVVLGREDLSWENLPNIVEHTLTSKKATSTGTNNYNRSRHSTDHWETYRY